MKREIPPERLAAFDLVAEVTKTTPVVVACQSRSVRRQYIRAIEKRGGRLEHLYFYALGDDDQESPA